MTSFPSSTGRLQAPYLGGADVCAVSPQEKFSHTTAIPGHALTVTLPPALCSGLAHAGSTFPLHCNTNTQTHPLYLHSCRGGSQASWAWACLNQFPSLLAGLGGGRDEGCPELKLKTGFWAVPRAPGEPVELLNAHQRH